VEKVLGEYDEKNKIKKKLSRCSVKK